MWIRSQNRRMLVNSNCVRAMDQCIIVITSEIQAAVGEYKTQERTLEVLDQIEDRLICGSSHDDMNGNRRVQKQFIFHMPEK